MVFRVRRGKANASFFLIFSLGLALGVPATADAAPQCNRRSIILALLESLYAEAPVAIGVANNGGLVEVLSTGDGATWSIIITTPKGMSCLVAAGEGWRMLKPAEPDT